VGEAGGPGEDGNARTIPKVKRHKAHKKKKNLEIERGHRLMKKATEELARLKGIQDTKEHLVTSIRSPGNYSAEG